MCKSDLFSQLAGVANELATIEERMIRIPLRLVMMLRDVVAGGHSLGPGVPWKCSGRDSDGHVENFPPFLFLAMSIFRSDETNSLAKCGGIGGK